MVSRRIAARLRRLHEGFGTGESSAPVVLLVRGTHPTVLVRIGTSDPDVFMQVFGAPQVTGPIPDSVAPGLIIDCGANAGYASVSLLERYPARRGDRG